jgi:anti-sigma factor ChrR (cupin superfamily)
MEVNADFSQRVVASAASARWIPSPEAGIERRMLDRIGGEVARATSIVRYLPGTAFPSHVHGGGEEIYVLEGVFSDEHGDYPAGSYLRNPPGSSHAPFSREGCVIFVKLWQFAPDDEQAVRIDTNLATWKPRPRLGSRELVVHRHGETVTRLLESEPHRQLPHHKHAGGEETYVVRGAFFDAAGEYSAGAWLRLPDGSAHAPETGPEGALLLIKTGHLNGPTLPLPPQ